MPKEIERRSVNTQIRMSQGDEPAIMGYAAKFGVLSHPIPGPRGMYLERIAPSAFSKTIANPDVRFLMNHDVSKVLGRTGSGTLSLKADSVGLYFNCILPPTSTAADLRALIMRGDIDECSFGFMMNDDGDDWENGVDDDGNRCQIRTLKSVRLLDVSAVTYPAYPETSVSARSRSFPHYTVHASDTDALLRSFNRTLGEYIRQSDARFEKDREQRRRMRAAAGITSDPVED